jgi:hypothetical protein
MQLAGSIPIKSEATEFAAGRSGAALIDTFTPFNRPRFKGAQNAAGG